MPMTPIERAEGSPKCRRYRGQVWRLKFSLSEASLSLLVLPINSLSTLNPG